MGNKAKYSVVTWRARRGFEASDMPERICLRRGLTRGARTIVASCGVVNLRLLAATEYSVPSDVSRGLALKCVAVTFGIPARVS